MRQRRGQAYQVRTLGRWTKQWGAKRGDFIVDTGPDDPAVAPERRFILVRPLGIGAATGALLHEIADGHIELVESMDPPAEGGLRVIRVEGA
jgi:hypothetical protein